jgi:hypothetical protein
LAINGERALNGVLAGFAQSFGGSSLGFQGGLPNGNRAACNNGYTNELAPGKAMFVVV